jgi:hypothetical protein
MIKIIRLLNELEKSYQVFSVKDSIKNTFNQYTIKELENVLGMLVQLQLYNFRDSEKYFSMINKLELENLRALKEHNKVFFGDYGEITLSLSKGDN